MKFTALLRIFWVLLAWGGLAACALLRESTPAAEQADKGPRVYAIDVVNHGWHTGVVLPASEMQQRLPHLLERFPGTPYLEFGWGDAAFYRAERGTAGLALRALLWPTGSVMHVVAVPDSAPRYFPSSPQERLCLTRRQYLTLVDFVAVSFDVDEGREGLPLGRGLYGDSQFYRARGKYHLFNTCNTWVANGLREAGLAVNPALMVTAENLLNFLRSQRIEYDIDAALGQASCY